VTFTDGRANKLKTLTLLAGCDYAADRGTKKEEKMKKSVSTVLIPGLVVVLFVVSLTGCERPVPEPPTPTVARVLMSPQPPPATVSKGPTTVSVLQTPGAPAATIVWDVPTFTPTSQVPAPKTPTPVPQAPTSTPQPGLVSPTPTQVPAPGGAITHKVEWGDTLYGLAARYGTTVSAIVAANNLPNPNFIRVGQTLIIPQGAQPSPGQPQQQTYIVQPGDTLYGIALRFNTTIATIAQANGIVNPAFIRAGQRLVIPVGAAGTPSQGGRLYVVQPGDTLTAIAARFGTTVWAIAMANNLPNANFIRAGQILIIPGP